MRLRKQHFTVLISFLFIVSTLLPACQVGPPVVAADTGESRTSAQPEPVVPVTVPEPLPPRVVLVTPETGEEIPLDAPLQVVFDQPMDAAAVEAAFSIDPPVVGNFEWPLPHIMEFKPKTGFERATRYTVRLEESGLSQAGLPLQEALSYHFETVGFLEVTTVQPADGTAEVAAEAVVTVLFNRPVVPLTAIEDQDRLPQPITFVPPVRGKGEWLNTSIYMFTPDEGFEPATTYKARIGHSLTDTTGGVLAEDYTWEFTTVMPAVVATSPDEDDIYVSIEPTIQVAFNQPMDRKSAEAGFAMYCGKTAEEVEGAFEWSDEGLAQPEETGQRGYSYTWDEGEGPPSVGAETMSFTPHRPLDFGTTCLGVIAEGTQGAKGQTGTGEDYMWAFTTIEYPSILSTYPADGDDDADPWDNLQVTFSSPMDPGSINDNFTITPAITATEVHTYWWSSNTRLEISFDTKASSNYKVTLSRNIRGRDGQKLDKDTTIRWGTRAMDPMVYLYAPYRVGTYLAYTPTMAYVNVRNLNQVDFGLYHMPLEDFRRANGEDSWEYWGDYVGTRKNLVRSWSLPVAPELNESLVYGTNLAGEKGASLDPGIYYLEAEAPSDAVYPEAKGYDWLPLERQIIVVSKHNLTLKTTATDSLVWAADLKSGDVSPGLPVQLVNKRGDVLTKGKTDRDGVFVGDEHEPIDVWDSVFAFVGDPDKPDEDFAITISRWDDGISPWEFDMPVEDYLQPVTAYFFTDRTIYRPGQKVYFKGIIREDDDAHYALPGQHSEVEMAIYDGQGTRVFEESMSLSDMGTVDGEFELSEEAALGYYAIEAIYEEQYISAGFQVAEYRKPEFQVAVETDKPEYVQGDKVNATAQATYFFGGPVADAEVGYSVLSADCFFDYQGKGWWDFTDYDTSRRGEYYGSYGEVIAEGTGVTDSEGRFTFRAEADIAEYTSSQLFTLEATVTDINDQQVSSRTEALVHKGLYYIGLRPERYVGQAGKENSVNVITVDWDSQPAPNRELTVVLAEHNWYSVRKQADDGQYYWESTVEDVPVYTTTVETDSDGEASVSFVPETGGTYKVMASGLDEKEHKIRSSAYMWISGYRFINWRQENDDRIDLVADQRQYQVGDTATILIPHPYQGPVKALITLERGHIYQHWVQTLETNSEQIEIPITEDMIPNVFVSVVIVK
nr:Ig-like domain-containing protein [Ardenticatenia bacterium]